jgi:hypothetical protein
MARTFTMQESKFGAEAGLYQAKFLGVKDKDHPEYGPGLEWQFEILDGPARGRIVSRTTAPQPSMKNSCGKMLQQITGGVLKAESQVDLDRYVGQRFQVMVEANSTGNGTRVGTVMPLGGTPAAAQPDPSPATPSSPPPPPPRRPSPPAAERLWVQFGEGGPDPELLPRADIQAKIHAGTAEAFAECVVMPENQAGGWKPAAECGFESPVPF